MPQERILAERSGKSFINAIGGSTLLNRLSFIGGPRPIFSQPQLGPPPLLGGKSNRWAVQQLTNVGVFHGSRQHLRPLLLQRRICTHKNVRCCVL